MESVEQMAKQEKKTEAIEVRVPFETKKAFMEACKAKGDTASGVLRSSINNYLGSRKAKLVKSSLSVLVVVVGGIGFGAAFPLLGQGDEGPSAINPLAARYFEQVDTNQDMRVSSEEFVKAITSRGSTSRDDIADDETMLRTVGVALAIKQTASKELSLAGRKSSCFETLQQLGDAERAREFYSLDKDEDNQLTLLEFSESWRIPSESELLLDFEAKDKNGDLLLDREEAAEPVEHWMALYATPNNSRTISRFQKVPEACLNEGQSVDSGRLYVKFEQLKRHIEILSSDLTPLVDGLTDAKFEYLDANNDSHLAYHEFLDWYLLPINYQISN